MPKEKDPLWENLEQVDSKLNYYSSHEVFGREDDMVGNPSGNKASEPVSDGIKESGCFDASQYAFFGHNVLEEVELGGLEDSDNDAGPLGADDEELSYTSFGNIEEMNKALTDTRNAENVGQSGPLSREGSNTPNWPQGLDFLNWSEQPRVDAGSIPENERWWSQPYSSPAYVEESRHLMRASSYPQQTEQFDNCNDPVLLPRSSVTAFAPDSGSQALPNLTRHSSIPTPNGGLQIPFPASTPINYQLSQLQLAGQGQSRGHHGVSSHFAPPNAPNNSWPTNQWPNQQNLFPRDGQSVSLNLLQNQLPRPNGLMNSQLMLQRPQMLHQLRPPFSHYSNLSNPSFNPDLSTLQMINNTVGMPDVMDPRLKATLRGRHNQFSQPVENSSMQRYDGRLQKIRYKYMLPEEIENIVRMQHAATHSNDPYTDDYYHQACLAKSSRLKHHFCPVNVDDTFSNSRPNKEAHAYLKIDALGRLSFSSIRRPRPLLEVDPPSASGDNNPEHKLSLKTLDEEPMLAARITIEDCLCLLLDIDDIDRFLHFNQPLDGGSELKQRRQVLLEGLAASLQLADPLGPKKAGNSAGLTLEDDLVFLRIISLPKGRKLLVRFLQLFPGSELTRIVCMTIFRHLRFLFGSLPSDSCSEETIRNLARIVSSCINRMDLNGLSACLASMVCSLEKPLLRPIGSSCDGASIVMKSLLDRATELLSDSHAASNYNLTNRTLWQRSFDSFFALLTEYCMSKYDSIVQSLHQQATVPVSIATEAAKALSKEMPVDLLRASLPHTNEQQRKVLLDFAQRTVPTNGGS